MEIQNLEEEEKENVLNLIVQANSECENFLRNENLNKL